MRKGEIACDKQFLLFSQCFLPYIIFQFKYTLKCHLQLLSFWTSLKCCLVMGLLFATQSLTFNDLEKDAFQKHCRKRRNCSILSFSHDVFYPAQQRFQFFNDIFFLSSSNPFRLDKSANLLFGEELTLSQMTKFRLSQTQRVWYDNFKFVENGTSSLKG